MWAQAVFVISFCSPLSPDLDEFKSILDDSEMELREELKTEVLLPLLKQIQFDLVSFDNSFSPPQNMIQEVFTKKESKEMALGLFELAYDDPSFLKMWLSIVEDSGENPELRKMMLIISADGILNHKNLSSEFIRLLDASPEFEENLYQYLQRLALNDSSPAGIQALRMLSFFDSEKLSSFWMKKMTQLDIFKDLYSAQMALGNFAFLLVQGWLDHVQFPSSSILHQLRRLEKQILETDANDHDRQMIRVIATVIADRHYHDTGDSSWFRIFEGQRDETSTLTTLLITRNETVLKIFPSELDQALSHSDDFVLFLLASRFREQLNSSQIKRLAERKPIAINLSIFAALGERARKFAPQIIASLEKIENTPSSTAPLYSLALVGGSDVQIYFANLEKKLKSHSLFEKSNSPPSRDDGEDLKNLRSDIFQLEHAQKILKLMETINSASDQQERLKALDELSRQSIEVSHLEWPMYRILLDQSAPLFLKKRALQILSASSTGTGASLLENFVKWIESLPRARQQQYLALKTQAEDAAKKIRGELKIVSPTAARFTKIIP